MKATPQTPSNGALIYDAFYILDLQEFVLYIIYMCMQEYLFICS